MAETEATAFYDYNGLPAYRDDKGILIVTPGGEEKPVSDLVKFVHEAQPITEPEFQKLKGPEARADETHEHWAGEFEGVEREAKEASEKAKESGSAADHKEAASAHYRAMQAYAASNTQARAEGDTAKFESGMAKYREHQAANEAHEHAAPPKPTTAAKAQVAARAKAAQAVDISNAIAGQRARLTDHEGYGKKLPSPEHAAAARAHIERAESHLRLGEHRESRSRIELAKDEIEKGLR